MDADGVEIFHITNGDGGVVCIADDLIFNLLVAADGFFDENLVYGGKLQRVLHDLAQLLLIVRKAAAGAAQRKGGAQNDRVSDVLRRPYTLLNGVCDLGRADRLADLFTQLLEQFSVLGAGDRIGGCAEQLDLAFPQNALLFQLHGKIESRLTADTGNNGIGALVTDDFCDIFQGQGFHIDLVGNGAVGHDGRGVGVG